VKLEQVEQEAHWQASSAGIVLQLKSTCYPHVSHYRIGNSVEICSTAVYNCPAENLDRSSDWVQHDWEQNDDA
jgi:hypothetical protein